MEEVNEGTEVPFESILAEATERKNFEWLDCKAGKTEDNCLMYPFETKNHSFHLIEF
jgi:hypothetical protein